MSTTGVRIERSMLRVEFDGTGPSKLVVPLVFEEGVHREVSLTIRPRPGVKLSNTVDVGDALRSTFARNYSSSLGGSFFATASHTRGQAQSLPAYEVVYLPDFVTLLVKIHRHDVSVDAEGIQLAIPIQAYEPNTASDHFAEITVTAKGEVVDSATVPIEISPHAARVLLATGYPDGESFPDLDHHAHQLSHASRGYITFSELNRATMTTLSEIISGYDALHLITNVDGRGILLGSEVSATDVFAMLNGHGLKFLYLETCNSVQVVGLYRQTDIGALIAATENLLLDYSVNFAATFYESLSAGDALSAAFASAARRSEAVEVRSRFVSGAYGPMFLDLRHDVSFAKPTGA